MSDNDNNGNGADIEAQVAEAVAQSEGATEVDIVIRYDFATGAFRGMGVPQGMGPVLVLGLLRVAEDFYLQKLHKTAHNTPRIVPASTIPFPPRVS